MTPYLTRITGYIRFTNEIGAAPANTGFMNNGMIRLKVIDPMALKVNVLMEVSTEKFNAAAQNNPNSGVGSPQNPHDLNNMLYPNNTISAVVPSGSILQITPSGLFENQFVETDAGVTVDLSAFAGCSSTVLGRNSTFKRIESNTLNLVECHFHEMVLYQRSYNEQLWNTRIACNVVCPSLMMSATWCPQRTCTYPCWLP